MEKSYITDEEQKKCRKVMNAFQELYEQEEVAVMDTGRFGFVKVRWFKENVGFEQMETFWDSDKLFEALWEVWYEEHLLDLVRGTPEAERDYDEIFERLPEEQHQIFVDKKAYFKSLCR